MAKRISNKKEERRLEDFCALWEQKSKNGLEYLTGKDADGNKIVAFYNESKKNPNEPDIRVYYSNDKD